MSPQERFVGLVKPKELITENVLSTLLGVVEIPTYVYAAPFDGNEIEIREILVQAPETRTASVYIVRDRTLYSFNNLTNDNSPYRNVIDPYTAERLPALDWWDTPDLSRWYIELLNRALNKITGRRGLHLDKEHHRYYFPPAEGGKAHEISYKSIGGKRATRKVAWSPKFKHSGEHKSFWEHLAVSLKFYRVSHQQWCLAIRPERRFTSDGFEPLPPRRTGQKSTSRKARMRNLDVLKEVHFWRDYLSDGRPRIICDFAQQAVVITNELLSVDARWPKILDAQTGFMQAEYEDDLFSWVDFLDATQHDVNELRDGVLEDAPDDWEADEPR